MATELQKKQLLKSLVNLLDECQQAGLIEEICEYVQDDCVSEFCTGVDSFYADLVNNADI